MPHAGNPCPACKKVQTLAGPVCRECLTVSLQFSKEDVRTLLMYPDSVDAQELQEQVEWWIEYCPINQHDRTVV
jgi:hypothetical protein